MMERDLFLETNVKNQLLEKQVMILSTCMHISEKHWMHIETRKQMAQEERLVFQWC